MSESENSSQLTGNGLPVDGGVTPWWKAFSENQEWRDRLAKKCSFKTMDIVDDEMIGSNNTTINEGGLKGVIAGAVMALSIVGGSVALNHFLAKPAKEIVEKTIEKTKVYGTDIEMEVIPPE